MAAFNLDHETASRLQKIWPFHLTSDGKGGSRFTLAPEEITAVNEMGSLLQDYISKASDTPTASRRSIEADRTARLAAIIAAPGGSPGFAQALQKQTGGTPNSPEGEAKEFHTWLSSKISQLGDGEPWVSVTEVDPTTLEVDSDTGEALSGCGFTLKFGGQGKVTFIGDGSYDSYKSVFYAYNPIMAYGDDEPKQTDVATVKSFLGPVMDEIIKESNMTDEEIQAQWETEAEQAKNDAATFVERNKAKVGG